MALQLGPTDTAGHDPAGSAPRSPLPLFAALCVVFSAVLHAEPLAAAAADLHLQPGVVAGAVLSVVAFFNLAILSLNFIVVRRPAAAGPTTATAGAAPAPAASASRSPVAFFMGLCLLMGAALHAEQLADAAKEYQIHPVVVVSVVLAASALFHLAILTIYKSLARHQAEDEPKQLRRPRGLPLLPFVVLALAIPTAASADTVMAAGATDLPQDASVWALLALAASFNIAIGSLYCFVIAGAPPPAATDVQPRLWSKAAGAMVSCTIAAGVLVSCMLLASGGAAGAIIAAPI
ncbi:hypothetical protein SETIT_2G220200v2 [Setaria italica]|uniref:Uncharacterized protein n=1 Tax=Setaria italica TaxID=4555 RepID=K4A3Q8_SETIT|nr:uncharacterized protein LOC101765202 [Setaria italica]RCV11857.1 hypothetical protein SETIT_2G220200v2 [Setaria italica]